MCSVWRGAGEGFARLGVPVRIRPTLIRSLSTRSGRVASHATTRPSCCCFGRAQLRASQTACLTERARSAQGVAPALSNPAMAERSATRAAPRCRSRRLASPSSSSERACSYRFPAAASIATDDSTCSVEPSTRPRIRRASPSRSGRPLATATASKGRTSGSASGDRPARTNASTRAGKLESGLAHARFASHDERASPPGSDVVDQAFDATLLVIPSDQHHSIVRRRRLTTHQPMFRVPAKH